MKIEFKVNYQKTLEAILYLLSKRDSVNLYNVMNALFEADKFHLNTHGRPVTGDLYIKKQYGVLPEAAYSIFQNDLMVMSALGLDKAPIELIGQHRYKGTRAPKLDLLSVTDLEALDKGIAEYFDLSFDDVKDKNHKEKCWIAGNYDCPINLADVITNPEVIEYLEELGPFSLVV